MNDKIVFGQYVNVDSWIHRLDPRTKIITLFSLMIGIFFINSIIPLLVFLGFNLIIVFTSKISLNKFLNSFKMVSMLLVFMTLFQILFNNTGEILVLNGFKFSFDLSLTLYNLIIGIVILVLYILSGKVIKKFRILSFVIAFIAIFAVQYFYKEGYLIVDYNISIYSGSIKTSILVLIRVINLLTLSALLTFTTKPTDLNSGIEGIFRPFKFMKSAISIFGMMISIALRFIPTLINESGKILKAQASRGVDFNDGTFKEKIMQIVSLLVPMFVISYKKAEDLANAMEARAYIPGEDRTKINELKYKLSDIFVFAFLLVFVGAIVTLKIMGLV